MITAGNQLGSSEPMRLLLEWGANPRIKTPRGRTALWFAVDSDNAAGVEVLIDAGAEVNEESEDVFRVICLAARNGNPNILELLLTAGASPHPHSDATKYLSASSYEIPLFEAAESGNANCVRMLLTAGVPAMVQDNRGDTALAHAGSPQVVRVLVEAGCPLDVFNQYSKTELDEALTSRRADVARELITMGTSLALCDQSGRSVLVRYVSSYEVDSELVKLLIDAGADIHTRFYNNQTVLHAASQLWAGDRRGQLGPVIKVLIDAGLPVDIRDDSGKTPLHLAVGDEGGDMGAIQMLLDMGADVNSLDGKGRTPLIIALKKGWYYARQTVPLLLSRGADPCLKALDGSTAYDFAVYNVEIWERIVNQRRQEPEPDQQNIENGLKLISDLEFVRDLVRLP